MKNHQILSQVGRSMIEMLGVLAIIGVLSVGAIAGYQKAIMKYKMNKQAQQASDLTAGMLDFLGKAGSYITNDDIASTFVKLGYIPDSMEKSTSAYAYLDNFGNEVLFKIQTSTNFGTYNMPLIGWTFTTSEQFINLVQAFQRFSDSIYRLNISDASSYWYGTQACKTAGNCLSAVTLTEWQNYVQTKYSTGGRVLIYFYRQ